MVVLTLRAGLGDGRSSFLLGEVLSEVMCGDQASLSTLLVACGVGDEVTLWAHSRQ
jgi:hypothetical protein